jgi:glucose dehydrogenase
VQLTKHGFAFVFDRTNGQPVWPIDERPVPKSDTPGERTSPTQPFPTKPPAYDQQGVRIDDLIDFTPELREEAIKILSQYRYGSLFTPPSVAGGSAGTKGTVQIPGAAGGSNWTGAGADQTANFSGIELVDENLVHLDSPRSVGNLTFSDTDISTSPCGSTSLNTASPIPGFGIGSRTCRKAASPARRFR